MRKFHQRGARASPPGYRAGEASEGSPGVVIRENFSDRDFFVVENYGPGSFLSRFPDLSPTEKLIVNVLQQDLLLRRCEECLEDKNNSQTHLVLRKNKKKGKRVFLFRIGPRR
jgi:hypothetical protein